MKKAVFMLLFVSFLQAVCAQTEKPVITVLDFTVENVATVEMSTFVNRLTSALFQTGKYKVIDTQQRKLVLEEMEFSASGCTDESCLLEIGKMLSAEIIVIGSISDIGGTYYVTTKMLETETAELLEITDDSFESGREMLDGATLIAAKLSGQEVAETEEKRERKKANPKTTWGIASLGCGAASAAAGIWCLNEFTVDSAVYNSSVRDYVQADSSADFESLNAAMQTGYDSALIDMIIGESTVIAGTVMATLGAGLLSNTEAMEPRVRRGLGWGALSAAAVSLGVGTYFLIDSVPGILAFYNALSGYTSSVSQTDIDAFAADVVDTSTALDNEKTYGEFLWGAGLVTAGIGFGVWSALLFFATPTSADSPVSIQIVPNGVILVCSIE